MDFLTQELTLPVWAWAAALIVGQVLYELGKLTWIVWQERMGVLMP